MKKTITCGCLSLSLLLVSVVVAQEPDSAAEEPTSGTTYMLPEFQFTTVTTTVDVPEGGTVLLGGIKELAEQRESESEAREASSTTTTSGTTINLPEFDFEASSERIPNPERILYDVYFSFLSPFYRYESPQRQPKIILGGIKELAEQRKSESEPVKVTSTTTSGTTINLPTFDFETTSMPIPTFELFQRLLYEAHFGFLSPFYRYESPERQPGILAKIPYLSMSKALRVQGLQEDDVELQLMLLVTPRIIFTEEEDLRLGL